MGPLRNLFVAFLLTASALASGASHPPQGAFNDDCETLLLQAVAQAEREVLVAVYTMTRTRIADALSKAADRGVVVRVKYDEKQRKEIASMSRALGLMRTHGVELIPVTVPEQASMHNKFVVVDGKTVLTGSFNFTVSASLYNWENLVRIDDARLARAYEDGWKAIRSGGRPISTRR